MSREEWPCGHRVHSDHLDPRWYFRSDRKCLLPPSGRSRMSQRKRNPAPDQRFQLASRVSLGSRFQKPGSPQYLIALSLSLSLYSGGWGGRKNPHWAVAWHTQGQRKGRPSNCEPEPCNLAVQVQKLIWKPTKLQQTTIQDPRSCSHPKAKLQGAVNPGVEPRPKPYWSQKTNVLLANGAQRATKWR